MHAVAMSVTMLCSVSLNLDKVGSWTIDVQDLFLRWCAVGVPGACPWMGRRPQAPGATPLRCLMGGAAAAAPSFRCRSFGGRRTAPETGAAGYIGLYVCGIAVNG